MAAEGKKGEPQKQITDKQRFTFIGFDVFPGKPKDLFKSDAEKSKHVDSVKAKRDKGDVVRDECKLLEERVSFFDRIVLTTACVVIFGTFGFPWFSAYNKIVEEINDEPVVAVVDSLAIADSTLMAMSDNVNGVTQALDSSVLGAATNDGNQVEPEQAIESETPGEEIMHGYVAKKKVIIEPASIAGFSVFLSIGTLGSYIFGSGFILMVTGVLLLLMLLACLTIPIYTLFGLYGLKGDADQQALALKKVLQFNWIPIILFFVAFILSFLGSEYGFESQTVFTSLGASYGPGVFMGSLSYGLVVSLGAFILVALKGVEI